MSKAASNQPEPPMQVPPIFVAPEDEQPKTLKAPIYLVYVSTKDKNGENVPIDCTPLDGLPQFPHQLAEKYPGHAFIELIARAENGQMVARVTHRCRSTAGAAAAAPAPAAATPGPLDAFALMQAINDRTDKLMMQLIAAKDASAAQIVDVIGKMSGQRIVDSQELFGTLLKAKQVNAGGGGGAGDQLPGFMQGYKFAERLFVAAREAEAEEGGGDGAELLDLLKTAAEAAKAVKDLKDDGPPSQPRPRRARVVNAEGQDVTDE